MHAHQLFMISTVGLWMTGIVHCIRSIFVVIQKEEVGTENTSLVNLMTIDFLLQKVVWHVVSADAFSLYSLLYNSKIV